jgi:hypothetical protein
MGIRSTHFLTLPRFLRWRKWICWLIGSHHAVVRAAAIATSVVSLPLPGLNPEQPRGGPDAGSNVLNQTERLRKLRCLRAGPMVRIPFPPAVSLQTLGPSRVAPSIL